MLVILSIKRMQSRMMTVYIMYSTVVFNMNSEIDQAPMKFNFFFYFILLYNTVLVLPYIDMNPPQVYMRSQT